MSTLWRHRDFRRLWAAETASQFATAISHSVFPLIAVTVLAATPFQMGILTSAEFAAFLVVGLPAGAWLDRVRRRPVMVLADFVRAALMLSVPVAWWLGVLTLTQLIVVAALVGLCTVFFDVAYQSYLPSLIGRGPLVDGNAKLQASQSVAQVAGPSAGGGLAQLAGAATAVLTMGLGYLLSALFVWRIKVPEPAPARRVSPNLRAEIAEGVRFIARVHSLRANVACTASTNFCNAMLHALFVLFLSRELRLDPAHVGLVLSCAGAGGILGALSVGAWNRLVGQVRSIWLVAVLCWPFGLLIPLGQPGWGAVLAAVGYAVLGYGIIVYNVCSVSFRQAICPDGLLGRMNATCRFFIWGIAPIGGFAGGSLGEWIGVRGTLWAATAGMLLCTLFLVFSPLRSMREVPAEPVPASDITARDAARPE